MPKSLVNASHAFFASLAWVNGAWVDNVVLTVGSNGCWSAIDMHPSLAAMQAATPLHGPVLPGLVNAHSHAFQRSFAGMAETRHNSSDHFWSWRDRMYAVANRVTPDQLRAIAAQLYLELLQGGYTQVCEFHYLHHDVGGAHHADAYAMSWALVQAAQQVGIGLTLLPVLYERAGFSGATLRPDQRRFASDTAFVSHLCKHFNTARIDHVNAGVAVHSLRAASPQSIHQLRKDLDGVDVPIHIHVSEQMSEVTECLAVTGARPVQWLSQQGLLDSRWHLVHATHASAEEIDLTALHDANVVICPTTEANLGDGFTHVAHWLTSQVGISIGSDSHVSRSWREELRWLEYGQRLKLQARNVCAAPEHGQASTAQRLFQAAHAGGACAAGLNATGLVMGARADFVVLDAHAPALLGIPTEHTLDAVIFAADTASIAQTYVAGNCIISKGMHGQQGLINAAYVAAMQQLWA